MDSLFKHTAGHPSFALSQTFNRPLG